MGNKTEVLTFEKCLSGLDLVKVENYKNELLDGFYLETDNHSFVRKGYYKKGKRNGYWQIKEEEKVSKGHYKNDKKIGLWEERVLSNVAKGKYDYYVGDWPLFKTYKEMCGLLVTKFGL